MELNIPGYTVIREISKGGMATIYLATQHSLARQVALKIMSPQLAGDPVFGERFLQEAKITGSMHHHNVVPVHDVGHFQDCHYLSMEFLPDGDLKRRIRAGIDPDLGLRVIYQVLDALAHVHSKSYIHRDIKPGNILFRDDQTAVLTDFGIAKLIDSASVDMTSSGTMVGSPRYMSPEQAKAEKIDFRTDIYSLGAVLYEVLAGRQLYYAESPIAVALKHISDPIPMLPARFAQLQPVLEKMLAKNPDDRYQSAIEVAEVLEPYVAAPCGQWVDIEQLIHQQKAVGGYNLHPGYKTRGKVAFTVVSRPANGLAPVQNEKYRTASALTLISSAIQLPEMQKSDQSAPSDPPNRPAPSELPDPSDQQITMQLPVHRRLQKWRWRKMGAASLPVWVIVAFAISMSLRPGDSVSVTTVSAQPNPAPDVPSLDVDVRTVQKAVAPPQQLVEIPDAGSKTSTLPQLPVPPETAADTVARLLAQANVAMLQYRLTLPVRANAYEKFMEVLKIDPANQAASDGINAIAGKYLALAGSALKSENVEKAQQYVVRARALATRHRLNADITQQIDDKQASINRIRYLVAQRNLENWNNLLQDPGALSVESLTRAYSDYMRMRLNFPDDERIFTANAVYADAFFQLGKKHFKLKDMDTSKRLIAMGLKINPQDTKLNDLDDRWKRRQQGNESFFDIFY